jgi:deoxyribodipyrimidine photo-lyase
MSSDAPARLRFRASDPRVRQLNDRPARARASGGEFVLYWSQMFRRGRDNAALAYAVARADELGVPCLFYEALRPDYPFASDRFHAFVLECARDTAAELADRGIAHAFFLPRTPAEARGVVGKLAARAAMVVSDDYPAFIVPAQNAAAAARAPCAYVVVDDCAGIPLSLFPKEEFAARTLRPKVLKARDAWILPLHDPDPKIAAKKRLDLPFEPLDLARSNLAACIAGCAIDHDVAPVACVPGGSRAAETRLSAFLRHQLSGYLADRNEPSRDATTHLSPYLHFGAISPRRIALAVREVAGERSLDEAGEAIQEQLLVRRGLAFNFALRNPSPTSYESTPRWAKETLAQHAADPRAPHLTLAELTDARSPDELWNAAQLELRARGVIHNYARMLWGKLVMLWMQPAEAHAALVHLNDRFALDGRDPDGWANIGWCFGLHDRPWPERAVYGKVRSMTSRSARSKLDFEEYIGRARQWRSEI